MCACVHLGEVTAEAGGPAAPRAGAGAAQILSAQDAVAALRVGTPGQVGATLHVASQQGILVLEARERRDGLNWGGEEPEVMGLGYLGDSVLVREHTADEERGGLSLAVWDWTVTVGHQVLLDPRRQVLLPARLQDKHSNTSDHRSQAPWPSLPPHFEVLTRQQ